MADVKIMDDAYLKSLEERCENIDSTVNSNIDLTIMSFLNKER